MMSMRVAACALCAAISGAVAGAEAVAQEVLTPQVRTMGPGDAGRISYPRAFFAEFRPGNAMDMVNRLPGFTFNEGDDVRGFGGAAGNVLIDGVRPSSKTVGLDQVLQRIGAGQVERIELIRAGAAGIDMQGHAVVANVVRSRAADTSWVAQTLIKPYPNGYVGIVPSLEATWRTGSASVEGAVGGRRDLHLDTGEGSVVRRAASGQVVAAGPFDSERETKNVTASGAAEAEVAQGVLRLNAGIDRTDNERVETSDLRGSPGGDLETARAKFREDEAEIGGDYQRQLTRRLNVQVIALHALERETLSSQAFARGTEQASIERSELNESIVRGVLRADDVGRFSIEAGAEAALNVLKSRSAFSVAGSPVVVPAANVRVEEQRAEAFATVNGRILTNLTLEAGLRFETSTIVQAGVGAEKQLSFLKPRMIVGYTPWPGAMLRVRLERTVGQLKFEDFAANAELEAGSVNAGNPDIEPERAWLGEVALEQRFWGDGVAILGFSHAEVEEVVDFAPVDGFDAPANIGDGYRDELKLSLSSPLDRLGLRATKLQFNGTWRWSRVTDPVTGIRRRISEQRPFEGDLIVSRSLADLNSTILLDMNFGDSETSYRLDEILRFQEQALVKLVWDWSPRPDLILRFQIENVFAKARKRHRTVFSGPRSAEVVEFQEVRAARQDPFLMFRIRKTF